MSDHLKIYGRGEGLPPLALPKSVEIETYPSLGLMGLEPLLSCPDGSLFSRTGVELKGAWAHPFFSGQTALLSGVFRTVPRGDLKRALSSGLFRPFLTCMGRDEASLLSELREAAVLGRGGAAYPAYRKWESFLQASPRNGVGKLLVCNGDEGNPGAFMDRLLLDGNPYAVLTGMMIAALVSGAQEGLIYLRGEYRRLYRDLVRLCLKAEELGILGDSMLGSGKALRICPVLGAGAYICGEESSLLRSLEGELPVPMLRPPFPTEQGYRMRPSLVHNVETWASIAEVFRIGGREYRSLGLDACGGTKLLSFSGEGIESALLELPFGAPLSEALNLLSTLPGTPYQQPELLELGGPSGGFLSPDAFHVPLTYPALSSLGADLGAGGVIALSDAEKQLSLIASMLEFSSEESCGYCTPCREGLPLLLSGLRRFLKDKDRPLALALLDGALRIRDASFCALGSGAVQPLISYLEEYLDDSEISFLYQDDCGQVYCAEPGEELLSARTVLARRGIPLPGFCFYPGLEPRGACRSCLIEQEGRIISACDHLAGSNGLYPYSTRARRAARFSLLLSAYHDLSDPYVMEQLLLAGIDREAFQDLYPAEKLILDAEQPETRCILCGLCVSACEEVPGRSVLCFSGKGSRRRVDTAFSCDSDLCIGCSACASVCPLGAIHLEEL